MRARLTNMSLQMRKDLGIHLWSVWIVESIKVYSVGQKKYPAETKYINCRHPKTGKHTRFLWYEVKLID